ncbi:hypothetical protein M422DRAFT_46615 [Sphaerobolus stellatus SS14]|uniref:Uncharacterized protein n=1 Tax=Sphaerobolus stellatus (strain SS14) TaxID=990650 RepID=A0A0C9URR6_SPHS4|nr:hypothetical protein M422DRAFT_46615 [Sphaerobolus stellatus SS14]
MNSRRSFGLMRISSISRQSNLKSLLPRVQYDRDPGLFHIGPGQSSRNLYEKVKSLSGYPLASHHRMAKKDDELMTALRGAEWNVGVVTEFVVRAYPKPEQIFAVFMFYPISQFQAISE